MEGQGRIDFYIQRTAVADKIRGVSHVMESNRDLHFSSFARGQASIVVTLQLCKFRIMYVRESMLERIVVFLLLTLPVFLLNWRRYTAYIASVLEKSGSDGTRQNEACQIRFARLSAGWEKTCERRQRVIGCQEQERSGSPTMRPFHHHHHHHHPVPYPPTHSPQPRQTTASMPEPAPLAAHSHPPPPGSTGTETHPSIV